VSKFRILSIFLAVGLLVGALGVGPVLAGQIDVTGLDTRDASYAPAQASADAVSLDDGEVKWTDDAGEGITFTKADTPVHFYIMDEDLEGYSEVQIATWTSGPSLSGNVGNGFNVLTSGTVRTPGNFDPMSASTLGLPQPADFSLTGPAVPAGDEDKDGVAGLDRGDTDGPNYRDHDGFKASTFFGKGNEDNPNPIHEVMSVILFGNPEDDAATSITSRAIVEADNDLISILGGVSGNMGTTTIKFTHHKRDMHTDRAHVFSSSDPDGEMVSILEVTGPGGGKHATSSTSQVFYGSLMLSSKAETQGTNEDGVWVQDGDTVTVDYLDDEEEVVDSDTLTVDSVAPAISGLTPADGTTTSTKNPTVEFTATDTGSTIPLKGVEDAITLRFGLSVDGDGDPLETGGVLDMGGFEVDDDDLSILGTGTGFRVIYTTTDDWEDAAGIKGVIKTDANTNKYVVIGVWAEDSAGNMASAATKVTIDTTLPKIGGTGAVTGWAWVNGKEKPGVVNAVRLTMNEAVDADSVQGSDFEIDNEAAVDAVVGTKDHAKNIYLTAANDLDPDAKPKVEIVADVSDMAGNEVAVDKAGSTTTAKDGLAPTVTVSRDTQLLVAEETVTITAEVDEKLSSNGAVVSIKGPDGSNANVEKNASSEGPLSYTLSREIGEGALTGIYGISVMVTDTNTNDGNNVESVSDEEAEVDGTTIIVAKGPIADANADGELTDSITALSVKNAEGTEVATSTHITAVDASARTITISVEGGATAVVSYEYVAADHTFEVDMDGPTAGNGESFFNVADEAELPNSSPFVKVSFNDDEYPGDSYTDVALTAATLTMGDGEAMDIADNFAAEANGHNYLWRGVNLALGEYTLAVTGEDTAGNSTDASLTFTIVEKPAYKVALNPGVNLISLPGDPATTSIEGVITNPDISSVLTYDPSTPTKWLAAERASDGSWVGNLTEITGKLGYWVTTSSFDSLEVDIVSFSAGGASLPPTHNLVPGWNLVPVTVLDESDTTVDANTYLGNNWLRAITYDSASGRFVSIGPDDEETPVLTVGKGYFVWMTKAHTVVP
jgi:hypothetical protein